MDKEKAELYALHMLGFIKTQWPAMNLVSLEVGRDDTTAVLWCKIHRREDELTHGGGHLFTVAYLERAEAPQQKQ